MQYISGRPSLGFKAILTKSDKCQSIFPLNQKKCYFFFSARYALAAAVEALNLKPEDQLLVPSYNCGVEIDPLLHLNIKPMFYKIKKDLYPDFDDLQKKLLVM